MRGARVVTLFAHAVAATWVFACGSTRDLAAVVVKDASAVAFGAAEGGDDAGLEAAAPWYTPDDMCPTSECPAPHETCPDSLNYCGTNLNDDPNNCGACGRRCSDGAIPANTESACVNGKCVYQCKNVSFIEPTANCNSFMEDGCEANLYCDPENCGACGNRCTHEQGGCQHGMCGCPQDFTWCGAPWTCEGSACRNLLTDPNNCGACGTVCPKTLSDGGQPPPHAIVGCSSGTCQVVCTSPWKDCNSDDEDGCETIANTNENCGACGKRCAATEICTRDLVSQQLVCACGPSKADCCSPPDVQCDGSCRDLSSDINSCGACDNRCPVPALAWFDAGFASADEGHMLATCTEGVCGLKCTPEYGDCNHALEDGCEAWLRFDRDNCGACGNTCNPDQPCVDGKCAVGPCDGGTITR